MVVNTVAEGEEVVRHQQQIGQPIDTYFSEERTISPKDLDQMGN
jgi:hypothetical protein